MIQQRFISELILCYAESIINLQITKLIPKI